MSHSFNATGASEYDAGANENPYAVWIRNVPTWVDEDRSVAYIFEDNVGIVFSGFTRKSANGTM